MAALVAACANMPGESASAALQRANIAMGGTALNSISFAGNGTGATFGQAYLAGQAWPKITIRLSLVSLTMKTLRSGKTARAAGLSLTAAGPCH